MTYVVPTVAYEEQEKRASKTTYVVPTIHPAMILRTSRPLTDVIRRDLCKANRISIQGPTQIENIIAVLPYHPAGLEVVVRDALGWLDRWIQLACPVAVDVETSSLDYFNCKLYSAGLSGEDGHNTAVAFTLRDRVTLPWDAQAALEQRLQLILGDVRIPKVFHNAPFDYAVLTMKGFPVNGRLEDTMALHHLVQPDIPHDLGWVGHTYLDVEPWKLNHKGDGGKMVFTEDLAELLVYNAKDALNTMKLRQPLLREIEERGMTAELISYQMELARIAAHMELVGLPINQATRARLGHEQLERIQLLLHRMRTWLNWSDFNPMAKAHAVVALYDKKYVGLTPSVWTPKTHQPSTKYENIIDYMEHPFVKDFIEYVEAHHVYATQYRDEPADPKGPKPGAYRRAMRSDGRLHPFWSSTGQKGSRFTSKPNCYDAETEVLTEHGWMYWPEAFSKQPKLLQYDAWNACAELIEPLAYFAHDSVPGDVLVTLQTEQLDLRVTADHRMLVEYAARQGKWTVLRRDVLPALDLTWRSLKWSAVPIRAKTIRSTELWKDCLAKGEVDWAQIANSITGRADTEKVSGRTAADCAAFEKDNVVKLRQQQNETFFCAEVPSGFLFVRRNGKICISGNCQNQRVKDRAFFEAPEGRVFVGSDLDQLELRLAAVFSGVPELLAEMSKPGGDPHRLAAIAVYGDEFLRQEAAMQKRMRDAVKTTVYASLYRGGVKTIHKSIRKKKFLDPALRAALTIGEVKKIYHGYFGRYPQINQWHDANYGRAQSIGYLEIPPFGRRRFFPVQPPPYTEVANWPIQCVSLKSTVFCDEGLLNFDQLANCCAKAMLPSRDYAPAVPIKTGKALLIEISLSTQEPPLFVSADHRFLVQTADDYEYKRADALQSTDLLCTALPVARPCADIRRRAWPYWLGAMISDGATAHSSRQLYFGISKNARLSNLAALFHRFAEERGWAPGHITAEKKHLLRVRPGETRDGLNRFKTDLEQWGYQYNWTCHTKRVPKAIFTGGYETIAQFVWGMLEADGTVTCMPDGNTPVYNLHMCNKSLLQQILLLCRFIGIEARLNGPYKPSPGAVSWRLDLHSYDVDSLFYPRRLAVRKRGRIKRDSLAPQAAVEAFLACVSASAYASHSSAATLHHRLRNGGSTHAWALYHLYMQAGAPAPTLYDTVKVKSVRQSQQQTDVYTMSVQHKQHQYLAQGFVSRNCSGSDYVARSMVHLQQDLSRFRDAWFVLHGHDALYIECYERDAEAVRQLVDLHFGTAVVDGPAGSVTLTAKAKIGKTLKDVK